MRPQFRIRWSGWAPGAASRALAAVLIGMATGDAHSQARRAVIRLRPIGAAPGVVRCWGFDSAADLAPDSRGPKVFASNNGQGPVQASLDTTQKASGASSLKFNLPSNSGSDWGGSWHSNFRTTSRSSSVKGEEQFFIQYRAFSIRSRASAPTIQDHRRLRRAAGETRTFSVEGSQAGMPGTYSLHRARDCLSAGQPEHARAASSAASTASWAGTSLLWELR